MGRIKGVVLNRKQYQNIKRMDHCQMSLWAESIYKSGYQDGQEATPGLSAQEIRETLLQVKGIGGKRLDAIVDALDAALQAKGQT